MTEVYQALIPTRKREDTIVPIGKTDDDFSEHVHDLNFRRIFVPV